jgi:hypothetical protein
VAKIAIFRPDFQQFRDLVLLQSNILNCYPILDHFGALSEIFIATSYFIITRSPHPVGFRYFTPRSIVLQEIRRLSELFFAQQEFIQRPSSDSG